MPTLLTFGDSILDCARYNRHGVHPGALLVKNDDHLFPEFRGRDLRTHDPSWELEARAVDGATSAGLSGQLDGLGAREDAVALLTVGGNDLLGALGFGGAAAQLFAEFRANVRRFLDRLPIRPVLVGNVYDPTCGDDARNFLPVDVRVAREAHRRLNDVLADLARDVGALVDLHAHFLSGDPSWFVQIIEPSLRGASEVRRCFLPAIEAARSGTLRT